MIGKIRTIPAGTKVFSIALQEEIKFERDIIVKVSNTIYGNKDYVFGKIQILLFEMTFPTLLDKSNGDIGFQLSDTKKYKLPKTQFLKWFKPKQDKLKGKSVDPQHSEGHDKLDGASIDPE